MPELHSFENQNPLVSVIIPTYNSCQWVGQAIDSVLGQTYSPIEIFVVDDGSTDDTATYLKARYDKQITYIYQPNEGAGKARNVGIKHAKGELLAFLDADDVMLPAKIARQVAYFKACPQYAVVYCDFWCVYEDAVNQWQVPPPKYKLEGVAGEIFHRLLKGNVMIPSAVTVRRECLKAVGEFFEVGQGCEDWDLWLRIASKGYQFGYLDERLVLYRVRSDSVSHNQYKMRSHQYRVFAHIKDSVPPERLQPALAQTDIAASFEFGVARANFEKKQYRAGVRQVLLSLRATRRRRIVYTAFCLTYLLLLPLLGYVRLEKTLIYLIEHLPKLRL
jgi:glycosyltransferase involved in cell wall biosynthesis